MLRISNLSVSTTAAVGAVVGVLTLADATLTSRAANFILTEDSAGYFGIAGSNLVTVQKSIPKGFYSIKVKSNATHVMLSGTGQFVVSVTN